MRIPKIIRSGNADSIKATKMIVVAKEEEINEINKAISQAMHKLAKKGYCKNGFVIINGIAPDNN